VIIKRITLICFSTTFCFSFLLYHILPLVILLCRSFQPLNASQIVENLPLTRKYSDSTEPFVSLAKQIWKFNFLNFRTAFSPSSTLSTTAIQIFLPDSSCFLFFYNRYIWYAAYYFKRKMNSVSKLWLKQIETNMIVLGTVTHTGNQTFSYFPNQC
jgi:hypothetical protein